MFCVCVLDIHDGSDWCPVVPNIGAQWCPLVPGAREDSFGFYVSKILLLVMFENKNILLELFCVTDYF